MDFETQLKQRMALAKQQGWNDSDIQRSALVERAVHTQQANQQATQQAQSQPKKTSGRGGFLSSLISEIGGAGGAAAGAAAGTAIMPGIGTILGGALGGLLGGTGGSAVEQEVRNGTVNTGKALKEGGLDALFSGAGEAVPVIKNAVKGGAAIKGAAGDLFADAAPQTVTRAPGAIQRVGANLKAGGLGLAQGDSARGADQLGAGASQQLIGSLQRLKVPLSSPEATQAALEPKIQQLGNAISTAYEHSNVTVAPNEVQGLATGILQKVATMGGLDKTAENYAMDQAQRLVNSASTGNLSDLWQYTKDLEKNTINFARPDSAAEPMKEAVAQIVKGDVRSFLNAKAPGLAELNGLYSDATTANKYLIGASKNSKGGMASRVLSLSPVKSLETRAGQTIENLGKATAGTATGPLSGPASLVTQQLGRQAVPDLAGAVTNSIQSAQTPQTQDPTLQALFANPTDQDQQLLNAAGQQGASTFDDFAGTLSAADQLQSGTGNAGGTGGTTQNPDDYVQAAMKALSAGDMKSYTALMGVAGDLQSYQSKAAASGGSGGTTSVTAQNASNAQQGASALSQLTQMLQKNPGVLKGAAVPGQGIPVVGGYIANATGAAPYEALANQVADMYLRLTSGAGTTPAEAQTIKEKLMPRAGDDAQTIQTKLQNMTSYFNNILGMAQGGSVGSGDQLAGLLGSGQGY